MDSDATLIAELHRLRRYRDDVAGAVLAGLDGMLIASDLPGVDGHHVAALAATSLGIGHRFTDTLGHGPVREYVLQAAGGCVVSYPAGGHALLTVVARPDANLDSLHSEARTVADRLGSVFDSHWHPAADPPAVEPHGPLALRTPMEALPTTLHTEFRLRLPPGFA